MPPLHYTLSREQVRRVDQIAIERYGVPGIVLMENAARGVIDAMKAERIAMDVALVLCGGGNNGGDGLAVARHLHNAGCGVTIGLCTDPTKYKGDALINWRIVQAMGLQVVECTPEWLERTLQAGGSESGPPLIIDAIFGTGLSQPPREPFSQIVQALEHSKPAIVAIDLPSGLDCDSGKPLGVRAVKADLTVTFVGLKKGFLEAGAENYTGKIIVADIGCPRAAIDEAMKDMAVG